MSEIRRWCSLLVSRRWRLVLARRLTLSSIGDEMVTLDFDKEEKKSGEDFCSPEEESSEMSRMEQSIASAILLVGVVQLD